jgi:hypothetical protein
MPLYRYKPLIVEAIQFTGHNTVEIAGLLGWSYSGDGDYSDSVVIETEDGDQSANIGDWVIRKPNGDGSTCRDEDFRTTFDPVDAGEEL